MYVSCHRHFFLVLLLNQRWSPTLRLHASHCSTFRIMCDVPSIAVFCSESVECFPGIASKFFFKLLVTIPVAPIITGTIVHLRFHIRCISINKLMYFNFFSASFCTTFLSAGIATYISVHVSVSSAVGGSNCGAGDESICGPHCAYVWDTTSYFIR